jgi:integrase/recombinase XerC
MTETRYTRIITTFQRHLERQRKHANTIRSYTNDAVQFFRWIGTTLGEDFDLAEVTRSDLLDYRAFLLTRNASSASVNRRITALRQFFDFCMAEKLTTINPVSDITGVPNEAHLPPALSRKDSLLLIRSSEQAGRPLETCIILLLLHAGLRSSEICNLAIGDLYLTPREGRLFVRGQRGKTMRFVYLSTRTQGAVRLYCKRRGISILARRRRVEPLLTHADGSPLTQQAVDHIVKRVGKAAGLPGVTPTILRNTCAVSLLLGGESPEAVGRVLGLSSLRNLMRFATALKDETPGETPAHR